ncbi:Eco57I restriction-modification methylase domain-containing protein [Flavobacterium sp.]|uniref:Eco57I restriction-modification methylase domain-containing protein n=1 Tax=Flavobacterium sp. TaxID=239 RepID=UPI0037C177DD
MGKSDLYTECYSLGNYVVDEYTKIGVFEIQLAPKVNLSRNRVALRNLIKEVSAQVAGAMVVFVQGDKWRFSYISKRKVKNKNTNQIEDKETAPKRYTYLFGKNEKALTAAIRFDKLIQKQQDNIFQFLTLNDFEEAFSVEKLGKEFFKNYKDTYEDFVQFLTGKRYTKKGNKYVEQVVHEPDWQLTALFEKEDKQARDFCKRMMGRIVFLYFIQKKGWLAVPPSKNWGEGNQNYLYELFKNSKNKDDFYYQELVPLFFKTLNNPDSENERNDFRFPYLNGGLFDDSHDRKFNKLHLPENIFSNLFETFNNYNFTVYEDAPDEHTVAVDPEMLGHIFENLLEDNKAKGAFYTPKEIVHYMCKESLKAYLVSQDVAKITDNDFANTTIDKILFQNELDTEEKQFAEKNAYKIIDALEQVKICDPAIGSGAFPMGMLLEIFNTQVYLQELKGFKKDISDADIKKHIIEESIYGVDIDPGAVDISRLRFWLSLVVDEPVPQPLPNLDFKIVCANTLIPLGNIEELDLNDKAGKAVKELEKLRHEFFNVSSENKLKLERQFKKIQTDLLSLRELATKSNYDIYTKLYEFNPFEDNSCSWFDAEWMFGIKNGFDIVIGNPPYGAKLSKSEKDLFKKTYSDVHMRTPDTFNYFISKSFKILKDNGVLSFIVPNNLLFQNENTKTRSLLVNTHQLKSVTNLGDNAFENADVPTCIFVGVKANNPSYNIYYNDSRKERIEEIDFYKPKKAFSNTDVNDAPDMVLGISSEEIKLMKAINSKCWSIDDIALEMASGISTGGDKIFRVEKHFAIDNDFEEELLKPVLVGGEIDKYKINDSEHLIIYTDRNTELKRFKNIYDYLLPHKDKLITRSEAKTGIMPWFSLNRQRYPLLFEEEKIIMRQTSDCIRACFDDSGYYCIDSILVFKINPKIQVSYKYALMMLNSKFNNFIYKIITQEEGRTFAQVKPQNVRKLFIPKITKKEQEVFEILCDYLMFLNDDKNEAIFNHTPNKRIATNIEDIANMMANELCFEEHMKTNDLDVLQFIKPKPIDDLSDKKEQAEIIMNFYLWLQTTDNKVRQRINSIDIKSPNILSIINIS